MQVWKGLASIIIVKMKFWPCLGYSRSARDSGVRFWSQQKASIRPRGFRGRRRFRCQILDEQHGFHRPRRKGVRTRFHCWWPSSRMPVFSVSLFKGVKRWWRKSPLNSCNLSVPCIFSINSVSWSPPIVNSPKWENFFVAPIEILFRLPESDVEMPWV